jgi:hypothetical protein
MERLPNAFTVAADADVTSCIVSNDAGSFDRHDLRLRLRLTPCRAVPKYLHRGAALSAARPLAHRRDTRNPRRDGSPEPCED